MHILLIEPDTVLGATYKRALEHTGHSVDHALSGQAAITCADARVPDIVLMEMQLPMQNGIAFLQEFRSYPEWQTIPAILHTYAPPHADESVHQALQREYGVTTWLYKPQTSLQHLVSVVHRQNVNQP